MRFGREKTTGRKRLTLSDLQPFTSDVWPLIPNFFCPHHVLFLLFFFFLKKGRDVDFRGEIQKTVPPLSNIPEHISCGGWNLEKCSMIILFFRDSSLLGVPVLHHCL